MKINRKQGIVLGIWMLIVFALNWVASGSLSAAFITTGVIAYLALVGIVIGEAL